MAAPLDNKAPNQARAPVHAHDQHARYYDAGLRYLAKQDCGLLIKEIAYDEGVSNSTVCRLLSLARRMPEQAARLWKDGLDTRQIARELKLPEATVYNLLASIPRGRRS